MKNSLTLTLLLLLTMSLHAENWMKRLPDDAYVANLSIPGSHDTGTGNGFPGITVSIYGPFGDKYARTQEKSFQDQWELGVRAFDMRPAAIIRKLELNKPQYRELAAYGQMGRTALGVKWEETDKAEELRRAAGC